MTRWRDNDLLHSAIVALMAFATMAGIAAVIGFLLWSLGMVIHALS